MTLNKRVIHTEIFRSVYLIDTQSIPTQILSYQKSRVVFGVFLVVYQHCVDIRLQLNAFQSHQDYQRPVLYGLRHSFSKLAEVIEVWIQYGLALRKNNIHRFQYVPSDDY